MVEALAACLIVTTLALAGVCAFLTVLIWKRLPQPDNVAAADLAQRLTEAWDAGARTRKNMERETEDNAYLRIETKRGQQQWKPEPHEPQPAEDESVELGTFGNAPIIPEMGRLA